MTFLRKDALAAIKVRTYLRLNARYHCTALHVAANDRDGGKAA